MAAEPEPKARTLALLPYALGRAPGQRYRIEQWTPLLADQGHQIDLDPFLPGWGMDVLYRHGHLSTKLAATLLGYARRLIRSARLAPYDLLFVYREAALLGPCWFERIAASRRPVVFDFDDAIYLRDESSTNRWAAHLRPAGKAATLCRLATHVTAGNATLADFARHYCRDVTVIPSTIDTNLYRPEPRPPNPKPVLGWTGSSTTAKYLEALHSTLLLLRDRVDFELRVIGANVKMPGIDVRCVPWDPRSEVEDLRPLDVGVMPLPDDEWSRGKCGMKALQYMALAIPPVVSPIGANHEIVRDGLNGFHASEPVQWVDRIARLFSDETLRLTLGAEARRTVEQGYSAEVHAPRVAQVFRQALRSASVRSTQRD